MTERIFQLENIHEIAKILIDGFKHKIIVFEGEMGAGKTTLIKEICRQLGVEHLANSPTYSIVNEYIGNEKIYHFDLFRLKTTEEALGFGIEEYLDSGHFCFIEWYEVIKPLLDQDYAIISIEKVSKNTRKLVLKNL